MIELFAKELPIWVWLAFAATSLIAFYLAFRWWLHEERRAANNEKD